jgi:hypothetical protein
MLIVPLITPGLVTIVATVEMAQPVLVIVYVILVVPAAIPPRTPVAEPIVPTAGLLLSHVPGVGVSDKVTVVPWHIVVVPDIAEGSGFTVTVVVA